MRTRAHGKTATTDAAGWHPELDEQQRCVLCALLAMQRHSWEQGVTSHALLDLGRHEMARAVPFDAVTRQTGDGRLGELHAPRAEDGTLFHLEPLPEMWADTVYMAGNVRRGAVVLPARDKRGIPV